MWALVVFLFVQNNLDVDLVNTLTYQVYSNETTVSAQEDCEKDAAIETKLLPLQPGNAARWQYARCDFIKP